MNPRVANGMTSPQRTRPVRWLLAANAAVIAAAVVMAWNPHTVAMVHWAEAAIVSLCYAARIRRAERQGVLGSRTYKIIFFLAHYLTFVALAFAALALWARGEWRMDVLSPVAVALLAVGHIVSYRGNYIGANEFRVIPANALQFIVYGRVGPVIVIAVLLAALLPSEPRWSGPLLAAIVLPIQFASHRWEHTTLPNHYPRA